MAMERGIDDLKERLGRIALCHEWLVGAWGSDLTASAIAECLGIREIYTLVSEPRIAAKLFRGRVEETWLSRLPRARHRWDLYLPLWPLAWRSLDLDSFDTVITSSHAFANAVRPRPDALHICYCYTPMRYAWAWRQEIRRVPTLVRPLWPAVAAGLRAVDRRLSQQPTAYISISQFVRDRIRRAYGRDSLVCYPPVDTEFFTPEKTTRDDYYLYAGRLVDYKRPVEAVEASHLIGRRLIVAGNGPELQRLRKLAVPSLVEFRTDVSRVEMRSLLRRARALLYPGIEDFGIIMVEAQAVGTPVIARRGGGASEIVRDGTTGILYEGGGSGSLARAILEFEDVDRVDWPEARSNAVRFSRSAFPSRLVGVLADAIDLSSR